MSGKRNALFGLLIALAVMVVGALSPQGALAATLYISEFPNGMSQIGSTSPQIYPQAAITDQTVALSGTSAQSSAFGSSTKAVMLVCDEGCSVTFGATSVSNPVATTSNYLLQQGVPYEFAVSPGTKVAAIANSAGNTGGGSGGPPANVNVAQAGGVAVVAGTAPVPVGFYNPSGGALLDPTLPAEVVGSVASGATDSGKPVKIGAIANTSPPTVTAGQRVDLQTDTRGNLKVTVGNAATFATVNSVSITGQSAQGGMWVNSVPLLYNGTNYDVAKNGGVVGMPGVNPQATPSGGASYSHIAAGQATTTVKSGAGTLYSITFNSAATATNVTTIFDSVTGSGTVIAIPAATTATVPTTLNFGPVGVAFATGLTILTATANGSDMTVVYK